MVQITVMRTAMKATTPPTILILMMRLSLLFKLGRPAPGRALLAVPVPVLLLDECLSLLGETYQIMSGSVTAPLTVVQFL
jgi:hypothetical protein